MKPKFIAYALQQLDEQKKQLAQNIENHRNSAHITKKEIREICAWRIIEAMPNIPTSICIDNTYHPYSEVINDEKLFEAMISMRIIRYKYSYYGNSPTADFHIDQERLSLDYWNRKRPLKNCRKKSNANVSISTMKREKSSCCAYMSYSHRMIWSNAPILQILN